MTEMEWQDIETAPKDGTVFIARDADHPNWGSWPMLRHVVWRFNPDIEDFVADDRGAWLRVGNYEPDYEDGHTTGRIATVPFSIAPDEYNQSVRYEWLPLPPPPTRISTGGR